MGIDFENGFRGRFETSGTSQKLLQLPVWSTFGSDEAHRTVHQSIRWAHI